MVDSAEEEAEAEAENGAAEEAAQALDSEAEDAMPL